MLILTLVQLINIHKKINKVVKSIKKSETPSIPTLKFKFRKGIQGKLLTNWKEPIDLLKKTHKNNEITYEIQDTFKATIFNNKWFEAGINNNKKVPINGNIIVKINKFDPSNINTSDINTL